MQNHILTEVLSNEESNNDSVTVEFQYLQSSKDRAKINKEVHNLRSTDTQTYHSILLDTGSTCSVFRNKVILENIRNSPTKLRAYTNRGHQDSKEIVTPPGYFDVWYNPESMVNILSFADIRKRFRVTIDSQKEAIITVHLDEEKTVKFTEVASGLYLYNTKGDNQSNNQLCNYTYINVEKKNKEGYTRVEILGADRAKELYRKTGMSGYKRFITLLQKNHIRNCPITTYDIK